MYTSPPWAVGDIRMYARRYRTAILLRKGLLYLRGIPDSHREVKEMQKAIERRGVQEENTEIRELVYTMLTADTYSSLQAINVLGTIGAPAVGPLVRVLLASNSDARWIAAMALARTGTPAVEPLIGVVLTADDEIKNPAIWALAEIGDRRAVNPLVGTLRTSRSECCRALTAAALLKLGDPAGIAEVEREFERSGEELRDIAMEAFEGT